MRRGHLLLALAIVIGLLYWNFTIKSIEQVTGVNLHDVTRIVFYDGRGGRYAPLTLEDEQNIAQFVRLLERYRVKRLAVVEPSAGWIHSANLYIDDKEVLRITFVNPIKINGEYYSIIRGQLSTNTIDDFLSPLR